MSIPTTAASPWPARAAYFSATIFIAASGTTNVVYGFSKGDTLATFLWLAVLFALSGQLNELGFMGYVGERLAMRLGDGQYEPDHSG